MFWKNILRLLYLYQWRLCWVGRHKREPQQDKESRPLLLLGVVVLGLHRDRKSGQKNVNQRFSKRTCSGYAIYLTLFLPDLDNNFAVYLSLDLHKWRSSSYKRSLQPSIENIQHFKTMKFLSMGIRIRNTAFHGSIYNALKIYNIEVEFNFLMTLCAHIKKRTPGMYKYV